MKSFSRLGKGGRAKVYRRARPPTSALCALFAPERWQEQIADPEGTRANVTRRVIAVPVMSTSCRFKIDENITQPYSGPEYRL